MLLANIAGNLMSVFPTRPLRPFDISLGEALGNSKNQNNDDWGFRSGSLILKTPSYHKMSVVYNTICSNMQKDGVSDSLE